MNALHDLGARLLRTADPETAHELSLASLAAGLGPRGPGDPPILAARLAGLPLANPVGLAAGFDKDARVPGALLAAGFGFVECGTVTPRPQAGNPRPRLFRLVEDGAVINRMGFNNAGLEAFAARLETGGRGGPVGANVGANKDTVDRAADYVAGLRRLWPLADYFTLNVSSPNTPGLRDLQQGGALTDLLAAVAEARTELTAGPAGGKPVFLKIAPDLTDAQAGAIVEAAVAFGLTGLIVSNTTLARPEDLRGQARGEAGGLSGRPLLEPSTRLLASVWAASAGRLVLIGVGGIASGGDAYAKIRAGASAVQLYTALALQGPGLVARIKSDLAARLQADGFASVEEAVGAA
ncbi:MAG TPA: quinone-dependent dihydroorotate dehydrogenase [Caulobacteraceae bacterium]|jgi:dihydroorotate dehydrogenase|nr:quinone-dependent dihydroorotate dehydrogenase [Caulobacteraceae bacterium]